VMQDIKIFPGRCDSVSRAKTTSLSLTLTAPSQIKIL
jgi:hypothetical protein